MDIAGAARQAVEAASTIADAASRAGVSATESFQRVKFAVEQGGSSVEALGAAFKTMSGHLVDGDKGTVAALDALGLNLEALQQMSPDQAFNTIADAIAKVPDPMRQSAIAVDLFGKSGNELLPAIKAGITEVGKAAPIMREQTVRALEEAGDQWEATQQRLQNLKAEALAPVLETFLKLPPTLQTVAGGITAFAPSLESLVLGLMAIGGPSGAMAIITTAGTALATFFTATLPAAFSAILPFLGPVGLIAAGVTAVVLVWKNWDSIVEIVTNVYTAIKTWLVDKFAELVPMVKAAIVSMVTGFVEMHVKVLEIAAAIYTGVKTWLVDKFAAIVDWVKEKVGAITGFFKNMYTAVVGESYVPDMIQGIAAQFAQLGEGMVKPGEQATTRVSDAFKQLAKDHKASADTMTSTTQGWLGTTSSILGEMGKKYKAFAIADAIIAAYLGIAKALALPFPANLVAAATVAAAAWANIAKLKGAETPAFATGGIVMGPMMGLVGEAGPEAIVPLSKLDSLIGGGREGGVADVLAGLTDKVDNLSRVLLRQQQLLPRMVRYQMLLAAANV
jgi:hypothetical protein